MPRFAILFCCCVLVACSGEPEAPPVVAERDSATVQALGDQIMVDPDLAQQNEANSALTGNTDHSIPPVVNTREAVQQAKLEAADLIGGASNLPALPAPEMKKDAMPESARYSVTELAKLSEGLAACADAASFTARWAAKMPEAFPIYPRGNTLEAAGNDAGGCSLRSVRFLSPVDTESILQFYAARAKTAGLAADYSSIGEFKVLQGSKAGRLYRVTIRRRSSGISEVGLVTSGF